MHKLGRRMVAGNDPVHRRPGNILVIGGPAATCAARTPTHRTGFPTMWERGCKHVHSWAEATSPGLRLTLRLPLFAVGWRPLPGGTLLKRSMDLVAGGIGPQRQPGGCQRLRSASCATGPPVLAGRPASGGPRAWRRACNRGTQLASRACSFSRGQLAVGLPHARARARRAG